MIGNVLVDKADRYTDQAPLSGEVTDQLPVSRMLLSVVNGIMTGIENEGIYCSSSPAAQVAMPPLFPAELQAEVNAWEKATDDDCERFESGLAE